MTQKEVENYLELIQMLGSDLGLDNIRELCKRLDNPQDKLKFIHIAGTNGKGSVALLVSQTLKEAGIKVGRYISPTISDYRERFWISGRMISKKDLGIYLERIKEKCDEMVAEGFHHPTGFEIETALAFLYFYEKGCELVVLETGLGGELDATNVIQNTLICVFTSISMDHMQFLGNNISRIAEQKAGILKKNAKVVIYPSPKEAVDIILKKCQSLSIPKKDISLTDATEIKKPKYGLKSQSFSYHTYDNIKLGLLGKHQLVNAAVALNVLDFIKQAGYQIDEQAVYRAFENANWSGRMEIIAKGPLFVLDGAHNADAANKLAMSIKQYFDGKRIIYIMGVLEDKEYDKIIQATYPYAEQIITVKTPNNERAMDAYELAVEVSKYHKKVTVADSLSEAVEMSYLLADKDSVILAFGSLSYLGELKQIVQKKISPVSRK